ncbi:hypothetical protein JAAARDRAFT_76067 [Jaapia argillacea MUCL 33604]|uniref:Uncharacterized protein n=1 Tax=Jaapia argillacea MUCL 33604 TaxID=933084 RepID=A0A067QEV3_9AGAM|nr:hypothetical protein JAAARDRAFT_76067 [Jaapia argillacea MUCL 33604]
MSDDRAPYSITLAPDGLSVDEVLHRLGCSPGWEVPDFEFIADWRKSPSPVPGVPTPDPRSTPSGKKDIQNTRTDANVRTIQPTEQLLDEHSAMARPKHKIIAVQEVKHDLHGRSYGHLAITGNAGSGTPDAVFPPYFVLRESDKTPRDRIDTMGSLPSPNQLGKRKWDEAVDEESDKESKERKEKRKREEINQYARNYLPESFREVKRMPNLDDVLGVHEMRKLQKKERDLEDRNALLAGKLGRVCEVLETPADAEKVEKRDEEMRAYLLEIVYGLSGIE